MDFTFYSRSGPPSFIEEWHEQVQWITGDSLKPETWRNHLADCDMVVHSIGTFFGSSRYKALLNSKNCTETAISIFEQAKTLVKPLSKSESLYFININRDTGVFFPLLSVVYIYI